MEKFISIPVVESSMYMFGGHQHTVPGGWSFFEQKHQAFELMCVIDGGQTTEFKNNKTLSYGPGDVVIISPGTSHTNKNSSIFKEMTYICFHFNFDSLKLKSKLIGYLANRVIDRDNEIALMSNRVARQVIDISGSTNLSTEVIKLKIQIVILQYMAYLAENVDHNINTSDSIFSEREATVSQEIAALIQSKVDDIEHTAFSFGDICNQLGISTGYGHRLFKKVYGVTPLHYIEDQKYQKAKILLGYDEYSIEDVAFMIGAGDIAVFSKQFKKWSGVTPSQYRRQISKKRIVRSKTQKGYFE
ncbi:AraC family transcriptional regulator [Lentilactobacillus curieae]|uniref:AraC family transcriptional regulator n=1 Tax=Lentilactobacillus curieae TaxID=1138822 RepID=A0A1S6QHB4_9LACO|nr:AraC family transcriptional regulator [Lentilactobacillus curieae]AQW20993.1 AraC family transcriptional regulator [Lentilactobacillus curieae]